MSREQATPSGGTTTTTNYDPNPIHSGPPSGRGSTSTGTGPRGKLLGVPQGYTVERAGQPHPGMPYPQYAHGFSYKTMSWGTQPADSTRYVVGDEWKPATKSSDDIVEMQRKLVMANYLSQSEGFQLGVWDERTRKAYRRLLEDANGQGLDADATLRRAIENGGVQIGGKGGHFAIDPNTGQLVEVPYQAQPLVLKDLPNKQDLARVFTAATADKLGRALSPEQISHMVDTYVWSEIANQYKVWQFGEEQARAQWEGRPPSQQALVLEQPPTPETFAADQARAIDPIGYQAQGMVDQFFNNMGQFWQSPVGG